MQTAQVSAVQPAAAPLQQQQQQQQQQLPPQYVQQPQQQQQQPPQSTPQQQPYSQQTHEHWRPQQPQYFQPPQHPQQQQPHFPPSLPRAPTPQHSALSTPRLPPQPPRPVSAVAAPSHTTVPFDEMLTYTHGGPDAAAQLAASMQPAWFAPPAAAQAPARSPGHAVVPFAHSPMRVPHLPTRSPYVASSLAAEDFLDAPPAARPGKAKGKKKTKKAAGGASSLDVTMASARRAVAAADAVAEPLLIPGRTATAKLARATRALAGLQKARYFASFYLFNCVAASSGGGDG
jgi:hypothetical protein